jgi:nucleoside-diphosphate-sugar epimerase
VLVTGSSGFLGREIVRQAVDCGLRTRGVSRCISRISSGEDAICADILDYATILPGFEKIEYVIHAAGRAHVFRNDSDSSSSFRTINEIGTANVAKACVTAGVKRMILVSSISVYGPQQFGGYNEDTICRPHGEYAESKRAAEQRAIEITDGSNTSLTILRFATIFGEEDPGNVARLIRVIDKGCFVRVGDGSNKKSLIYRGDAARACLVALSSPHKKMEIFNISSTPCMMSEIVALISSSVGRRVSRLMIPACIALRLNMLATFLTRGMIPPLIRKLLTEDICDASKFQRFFDFHPKISLAEGISREVSWYRNQK